MLYSLCIYFYLVLMSKTFFIKVSFAIVVFLLLNCICNYGKMENLLLIELLKDAFKLFINREENAVLRKSGHIMKSLKIECRKKKEWRIDKAQENFIILRSLIIYLMVWHLIECAKKFDKLSDFLALPRLTFFTHWWSHLFCI